MVDYLVNQQYYIDIDHPYASTDRAAMAAFREDQVAAAVNFLTNDRGLRGWIAESRSGAGVPPSSIGEF